jgi:hypothetical protein
MSFEVEERGLKVTCYALNGPTTTVMILVKYSEDNAIAMDHDDEFYWLTLTRVGSEVKRLFVFSFVKEPN